MINCIHQFQPSSLLSKLNAISKRDDSAIEDLLITIPQLFSKRIFHFAPELIVSSKNSYSKLCDIYGFGCMLFELLTHKHPYEHEFKEFYNSTFNQQLSKLKVMELKEKGIPPQCLSEEQVIQSNNVSQINDPSSTNILSRLYKIMKQCMDCDPQKRPNSMFELFVQVLSIQTGMLILAPDYIVPHSK